MVQQLTKTKSRVTTADYLVMYLHESVRTGVGRVAGLENVQLLLTQDGPGPAGGTSPLNTSCSVI